MTILLRVNLTTGKIEKENVTAWQQRYIGGLGVNTKLALTLLPPGCSPLSPANVLLAGPGSLSGTHLPTACRTEMTAKSPLSGRFGSANSGHKWGLQLRRAGYSYLAVEGRAARPQVLYIDDGEVILEDAALLWGQDTWFTVDWIREQKGRDFEVACIGPAGENLVTFAGIQNNHHAAWGRTGLGAVMGSKNLKAIAVRGKGKIKIARPAAFPGIKKEAFQRIRQEVSFGMTRKYGSMVVSSPINRMGGLPGRNYTRGSLPGWEETRGRRVFRERYKLKSLGCFSCPIACKYLSGAVEGPWQGYTAVGPEVTHVLEFGARLDLQSIPEILKCVETCNRLGLDVVSAAATIAFLIECGDNQLLSDADTGFLPRWGNLEDIQKMLQLIACREGSGALLAGGVKAAAAQIPGSEDFALHIKGVELSCRDPRAKCDTWALGYLTNTRGGDHLRVRSPVELLSAGLQSSDTEELGVAPERIDRLDMPPALKNKIFGSPPAHIYIPQMLKYAEDLLTIINSTGFCIRTPVLHSLGPDFFARALNIVTGSDFTAETLLNSAAQIWALQHRFNRQEGETKDEYRFPARFYHEPLPRNGGEPHPPLSPENVQKVLEAYFAIRNEDGE
ncbi:MAG: aldehyde ferredoxin oxidoreductase family protein [Dethiobacteria bacterium]|jgi:aldehyde:ferredoxin oxidoreductase